MNSPGQETEGGLSHLKYAGVGPSRSRGRNGKLAGEQITSLGSLEAEIMGILWDLGGPATSMDVMERSLYKRRAQQQEPVAFATIATTLRRLTEKGVLSTEKNQQRTPVYTPTVSREEMAARILNNVSVTLLGKPLHGLLPKLLDTPPAKQASPQSGAPEPQNVSLERLVQFLEAAAGTEDTSS